MRYYSINSVTILFIPTYRKTNDRLTNHPFSVMKTLAHRRKENLEKELRRIVASLVDNYSPEKIILFGSLAQNKIHEWSDIDLAIIKETDSRFLERLHQVRRLTTPKVGVNFIVYTPSEMNNMLREKHYFLLNEIIGKGKTIYEKS